jgi:hypothetical protein
MGLHAGAISNAFVCSRIRLPRVIYGFFGRDTHNIVWRQRISLRDFELIVCGSRNASDAV